MMNASNESMISIMKSLFRKVHLENLIFFVFECVSIIILEQKTKE